MNLNSSPVQKVYFRNQEFFIKRDDLIHADFSGNKARKFHFFLENDFPDIKKVIGYGSNQSNAMYSLSVLAKLKGWEFEYYVDHIPSFLKENPQGNYKYALMNGMKLKVENFDSSTFNIDNSTLLINEGGAIQEAQYGIKMLANEIKQWKEENKIDKLKIFLPSGTGTTALFLQKYLDDEVLTCPCVGDEKYLKKQFLELEQDKSLHPTILKTSKKFHFGKLYKENYEIWKKLKEDTKIEFDLLYDPIGWQTLLNSEFLIQNSKLLYIHQGGIIGNETMLRRYERKYDVRA